LQQAGELAEQVRQVDVHRGLVRPDRAEGAVRETGVEHVLEVESDAVGASAGITWYREPTLVKPTCPSPTRWLRLRLTR
jgi:hypothetical protein